MENQNTIPTFFEKNAALIKGFFVGFLILILLIPTFMIEALIRERQDRAKEVVAEVSSKWGNSQQLIGPILRIPYYQINKIEKVNASNNKEVELTKKLEYAYYLPEKLKITGNITPELRSRGIFDVTVYRSKINFEGKFEDFGAEKLNILPENMLWNEAKVLLTLSDFRGIEEEVILDWDGKKSAFNPGIQLDITSKENASGYISGIYTAVPLDINDKKSHNFKFSINLKGSESINFVPVGKTTEVVMSSNWPNPSFVGSFLPDNRSIDNKGFKASWKVLHLNRDFPQQWVSFAPQALQSSSFGVNLISPNDNYQKSSRSVKYAILIIALTFLAFFFTEIVNQVKMHPFNYILVGLALVIFYTLLISISEYTQFNWAYIVATIMTLALIFWYSKSIFQNKKPATVITSVMLVLYTFIFVIIQLEDTALLIGSIGLFIILAVTMYISRKIDWQSVGLKK